MKNRHVVSAILAAILLTLPTAVFGSAPESPKATISGDFDGTPGIEIASITGTSVRITSITTGAVRQYTVANWRSIQQADLDGQPGNELLFTNLLTINGFAQQAQATVLADRKRDVRTFDLGRPNRLQLVELDDQAGSEVLFTNLLTINGFAQPAQATVLTYSGRNVRTYELGRPNRMQLAELEGQPGSEVLFTNFLRINGVAQPAQVTILTHRGRDVRTYNVGNVADMELVELDGQPGSELLFTNLLTINGFAQPAQATVVTPRSREVKTYNAGRPNRLHMVELDGLPGSEILFTNLVSINGFPQPALATVLTHRTREIVNYDIGRPNRMQMVDMDGTPGDEVLFTNLMSINGVYQPASASVVTHWRRRVQSYKVGKPRGLQVADFDGVPGNEAAFVGDTSAVVVTPSEQDVQPYSLGSWSSYQVLDADGIVGNELLFRLRDGRKLMVIHRIRTIRVF